MPDESHASEQSRKRITKEEIDAIADELAEPILTGQPDPRLHVSKTGRVRVRTAAVLPPAPNRTMHDRRTKLYRALRERLVPRGWAQLRRGWWEPPGYWAKPDRDIGELTQILAQAIRSTRPDDRVERASISVRVRMRRLGLTGRSREIRERRQRLNRGLEEALKMHGWRRRGGGWWAKIYASLVNYRALAVCGQCGQVGIPDQPKGPGDVECRCNLGRRRGFPHAALCYCCGQILLDVTSKFSIWFCRGCLAQVRLLNSRLGRYAVPVGAHSLHGGLFLTNDASDLDIEIFVDSWRHVIEAMDAVREWAREVVRRLSRSRWPEVSTPSPILDYAARSEDTSAEKMRCFREMTEFLASWVPEEGRRSRP